MRPSVLVGRDERRAALKLVPGAFALAACAAAATAAQAQPYPPGSYLRQCRDISLNGQFLSARCRSAYGGWAQSSINVASCSTDIGVDREGGLVCGGPGAEPDRLPPPDVRPPPGYGRDTAIIFDRFGFRGRSMRLDGEEPNLAGTRFNDRVASISLGRRSGPWVVCEDAGYRGRCVTISDDVRDVRAFGLLDRISSLRPLYDRRPYR